MAGGPDGRQSSDEQPRALALDLTAAAVGLLAYGLLIGWVVTSVRLAAARLPADLATRAYPVGPLLATGLRTAFFMALVFAAGCLAAYFTSLRNWDANGPDWQALVHGGGIRSAHQPLQTDEGRRAWTVRRQRAVAGARRRRADRLAGIAPGHTLRGFLRRKRRPDRLAEHDHPGRLRARLERRRDEAQRVELAADPLAAADAARLRHRVSLLHRMRAHDRGTHLEARAEEREMDAGQQLVATPDPPTPRDPVLQVLAGFNIVVIAAVVGLWLGQAADFIVGASWITLPVGAVAAVAVWLALTRWGPLIAAPGMHGAAWVLAAAAAALVSAPLGLLLVATIAVATLGRPLARRPAPTSLIGVVRSPLPWALLGLYTLVAAAYYASPPIAFPRAVVTVAGSQEVGGYVGRSGSSIYLARCTPLADATSTGERVEVLPSSAIRNIELGGPPTYLDSGTRPTLASLALSALGVNASIGALVRVDLRARRGTCGGAEPQVLTRAHQDPALGAGVIVGSPPASGVAHDGEDTSTVTPAAIASLARLYQPTVEVSVADRFWPVSVESVIKEIGPGGRRTCIVTAGTACTPLASAAALGAAPSRDGYFLRFPAPRRSDPSNQFRAFLNGQYVFPGSDHRWLADPGLLDPWYTAQLYFYFAGPLVPEQAWPKLADQYPDIPKGMLGLEYWFFYPYNYYPTVINNSLIAQAPWAGDNFNTDLHQGDWEHVTVLLEAKTFTPRWLYMARHNEEGTFLPWDSPTLAFDGTHPIVQAAFGGHPTYDNHCGPRPRAFVLYLSSDWVVCGSGRYAFRGDDTPLVDLARVGWGCWKGYFGEGQESPKRGVVPEELDKVVKKGVELLYAKGPRSPLWQGENAQLYKGHGICTADPRAPEEDASAALGRGKPSPLGASALSALAASG
ncbi:MAG TPA: hypothetical protein VK272_05650 [Solirubrobacteraceae bacterium]|nr:hypothetical protein [Solirubrobacteraceae bacterium]